MTSTRCSNISKSPNKSSDVWVVPQDKLKILIRIRPVLNEQQQTQFVQLQNENTLLIKRPGNHTYMKFNNILPYYSTQKDVFNQLEQSVSQFLTGTNITIFAYGQTGAGKTYSIIGNYSSSPNCSTSLSEGDKENIYHLLSSEERGILSRSLEMIMEAVEGKSGQRVWMSFYEIYNQKIYDLYNKQGAGALDIRESKHGQISIPNLINIEITRIEQAIHYLMIGLKNRSTGSTHANAKSSRSHSIFQISIQSQGKTSSLRIVDLAGSEKFKIPSDLTALEKEIRIQQLTSINGSLSCLGHCISALIEKSRTHIPFRNSKLTRILSDSLLGQGKMRFIICISPSVSASAQTFSTLQFANRAKRAIFDRSQMRTPQMSKKKSQSQQMVNLRKQLQKQRQLRLTYEQELSVIKKQNVILKIENQKLKNRINQISSKAGEMSRSITNEKKSTFRSSSRSGENFEQQNYEPELKQNDSHEEMLNLPIFQKNRQLIPNPSSSSCSASRNKPINVKKAEFEKKIRKFIEQSSPQNKQKNSRVSPFGKSQINLPTRNQEQSRNNVMKPISQNQSMQKLRQMNKQQKKKQSTKDSRLTMNDIKKFQQERQNINVYEENEQQLDSLWQYHEEETQQFFEKACEKMNMKQYQDLKQQMQKAKSQLLRFKLMDDKIEKKKVSIVR